MTPIVKKPKAPKGANVNKRPVEVKSYFKKGKRVKGYNRRKAGDATERQ